MHPISNIVYQNQYLMILFILDLQEHIYTEVPKTYYMSAGEAGQHVIGFLDIFIDVFLEVQKKDILKYCI